MCSFFSDSLFCLAEINRKILIVFFYSKLKKIIIIDVFYTHTPQFPLLVYTILICKLDTILYLYSLTAPNKKGSISFSFLNATTFIN